MSSRLTSNHQAGDLSHANQKLMSSFAYGDAERVAALYAKEAQLFPAHSTAIVGRSAIQAFWQGCMDMGIRALHRQSTETEQLHDTVNEVGAYELYGRVGQRLDVGKYIVIWKWEEGRWQIYRDIWTSNLPPLPRKERDMR